MGNLKKWVKWKEKFYAYALENAIRHKGKAVMSKVLGHMFRAGLKKEEIITLV